MNYSRDILPFRLVTILKLPFNFLSTSLIVFYSIYQFRILEKYKWCIIRGFNYFEGLNHIRMKMYTDQR